MEEIWKDVVGYEGNYKISNLGRLMACDKVFTHRGFIMHKNAKILSTRIGRGGYEYTVFSVEKKRKTVKIHRLVADAFIPNIDNKPAVNHINGIKSDNRAENLEWATSKENTLHAIANGLKIGVRGEKSHLSKISKDIVSKIREMYSIGGISQSKVAKLHGISQSQVYRIVNHHNWK